MEPFHFPEGLVSLQAAWLDTYTAPAKAPAGIGSTPLRRRLIALPCRLDAHPHRTASGSAHGTWAELRRQARTHGWATAA
ncbi:hypothetical protein ACGFSI_26050 [Streptomyces virginiae]|uniref:hypothetical protein n=1 Tax=Streptomyces virginiae TaxID=1961 RepID=UPI00371AA304